MRKYLLRLFIISSVLFVTGCVQEKPVTQSVEASKIGVMEGHADLIGIPRNVVELEKMSEIIIEATYTGETEIVPFPESGLPDNETSLSKVKITKVHKGELKVGEEIYVSEPGHVDRAIYYTKSGYKNMDENGKYVLFLNKFVKEIDGKTTHVIKGAHFGKYDLTKTNKAEHIENAKTYDVIKNTEYFGDMADHFNELKEQVVEKYGE